ncbi:hypothetical protein DDB_G0267952 [Dictyostelium discoideum AX4]|uniref:Thioredoxin domain-containing protein n=1 Tax=Dictyostelium discoideum TaxID=44689 RepID=Q55FU1_DICDI|nr:hypothetical protein DDB_G0267952 [Dictyostelium discoideum AX4]EAL73429.1 hypothetical protein DDB_G0267952 [Dictyostelium discoideum AX4]|eukprot:XP_647442.1 hypothetical protein DDB_G0267952 [Dictyostelium discoideum AX4]
MKFNNILLIFFVTIVTFSFIISNVNCREFDFSEHPNVQVLSSKNINSFISSSKPSVIVYYGKIADQYYEEENNELLFGVLDLDTDIKVKNSHLIDSTPTIIYYKKGAEIAEFGGKKTRSTFEKFLENPLAPIKSSTGPGSWSHIESQVAHLNVRNFSSYISNHPEGVLVMFFTAGCGHCTKMKPAFGEASQIAIEKNIGSLAAVDCGVSQKVCEKFKIESYPNIYFFKDGKNVDKYNGDRSVNSLIEFLENNNNNNNNNNISSNSNKKSKKVKNEL